MNFLRWILGQVTRLKPGDYEIEPVAPSPRSQNARGWRDHARISGHSVPLDVARFWIAFSQQHDLCFVDVLLAGHVLRSKRYSGAKAAAMQHALCALVEDDGLIDRGGELVALRQAA